MILAPLAIKWEELQDAFAYVNSAPAGENSAHLSLVSGRIQRNSTWTDIWDKPGAGDKDADGETLSIPHKTELGLGRELALWFAEEVIPDLQEEVEGFFQKRGAYGKFKALLMQEGLLQEWYQFEKEAEEQGLKNWCEENGIPILPSASISETGA